MSKNKKNGGGAAVLEAPAETKPAKKAEKPAEPEKKKITTTELAAMVGTKPTILRRYLRTLPRFQDNGYTRYGWDEDDQFLADAKASFEKYQKASEEKKEARLEEARKKAETKKESKAKAKKEEPAEEAESEEVEEEGDFEESDEGEELE